MLNGEVGYGDGYGGQGLPFFKNFYAGGVSSVRGYDTATIGPKYLDQYQNVVSAGGTQRVVANAEILFPMPGMGNDKSVRLSAFFDAGEVAGPGDYLGRYSSFSFQDLRYSTGLAVNWISPVGPLKFSLAQPLNPQTDDKKQVFQFTLGQVF